MMIILYYSLFLIINVFKQIFLSNSNNLPYSVQRAFIFFVFCAFRLITHFCLTLLFWWVYCYIFHFFMFVDALNFIWKDRLWRLMIAFLGNIFIVFIWIHLRASFQYSTVHLLWSKRILINFFIILYDFMCLLDCLSCTLISVVWL